MGYDPAQVYDEVIIPIRQGVSDKIDAYLHGTLEGYDNIEQIIEEGLWKVFNNDASNTYLLNNMTELKEAIEKAVLEVYGKGDDGEQEDTYVR